MLFLYRVLLWVAMPLIGIISVIRICIKKDTYQSFLQRCCLGRQDHIPKGVCQRQLWWFHAVSIGEMQAALPLIQHVLKHNDDIEILLTTQTLSAKRVFDQWLLRHKRYEEKQKNVTNLQNKGGTESKEDAESKDNFDWWGHRLRHQFIPYDYPVLWNYFIKLWQPKRCYIIENDFWPHMLSILHKNKIPVFLLNAKLSERSFGFWKKSRAMRALWKDIHMIVARLKDNAERLLQLTGRDIPYTDNIKFLYFDQSAYDLSHKNKHALREADKEPSQQNAHASEKAGAVRSGFSSDAQHAGHQNTGMGNASSCRLVFANIHPGESEWIARFLGALRQSRYLDRVDLLLIPRHIEKAEVIRGRLLKTLGVSDQQLQGAVDIQIYHKRSLLPASPYPGHWNPGPLQMPILAAFGHNRDIYKQADIVLIGGSLMPHEGHNPLEPQCLASIVAMGVESSLFPAPGLQKHRIKSPENHQKTKTDMFTEYMFNEEHHIFHVHGHKNLMDLVVDYLEAPDAFDQFLQHQRDYLSQKRQKIWTVYKPLLQKE
jgi:3-deoxy-D-manno-octulosonic-acid transferase